MDSNFWSLVLVRVVERTDFKYWDVAPVRFHRQKTKARQCSGQKSSYGNRSFGISSGARVGASVTPFLHVLNRTFVLPQ